MATLCFPAIKLQSEAFALIKAQEELGLIFCARSDSVVNKDRAPAEIAKSITMQQFTRFREGLKCIQVYLPGGYYGQVTVELAKIPSPAACTAVAERIATMSELGT